MVKAVREMTMFPPESRSTHVKHVAWQCFMFPGKVEHKEKDTNEKESRDGIWQPLEGYGDDEAVRGKSSFAQCSFTSMNKLNEQQRPRPMTIEWRD